MAYDNGPVIQAQKLFTLATNGSGATDLTQHVADFASRVGYPSGLLALTVAGGGASVAVLPIDDGARSEVAAFYNGLAGEQSPAAAAVIRAAALGSSVSLSLNEGGVELDADCGVYLVEHRPGGGKRAVVATVAGVTNQDG